MLQHLIKELEGHIMDEGLLKLRWPLQEIILSDNIQFLRCKPVEGDEQPRIATEYESRKVAVIGSSLTSFAITWSTHGEDNDDPVRHRIGSLRTTWWMHSSILVRCHGAMRIAKFCCPIEKNVMLQLNSTRVISKPRDFILPIMPQYGF